MSECICYDKSLRVMKKKKRLKNSTIESEKFKMAHNTEKSYIAARTQTRCNSIQFVIKRIIATKDPMLQVLLETKEAPIAEDEISVLFEVQSLLEIFQEATEKIKTVISFSFTKF